jgi:hypothetical protein
MSSNPRRPGGRVRPSSGTTADVTPTLAAAVQAMPPGPGLDGHVATALGRLGESLPADGLSTTWEGARRLVERLTAMGYYLEMQIHADRCLCRVLKVLRGNAVSKQLAGAEGPCLPEAVAKAALLAFLEAQPPAG